MTTTRRVVRRQEDSTGTRRIRFDAPVNGRYGSATVRIIEGGSAGVRVQHSTPLHPGTKATLAYHLHGSLVAIPGLVVWSHLAVQKSEAGVVSYESGIQVDRDHHLLARLIHFFTGNLELALPDREIESRRLLRAVLDPPLEARFGVSTVTMIDLSSIGVRIRHDRPFTVGLENQLQFVPGPDASERVAVRGVVSWTRLESFARDTTNRPAYVSGIAILNPQELADALMLLEAHKVATLADSTLDRKRRKIHERLVQTERPVRPDLPVRQSKKVDATASRSTPREPARVSPARGTAAAPIAKQAAPIRIRRRLVLNMAVLAFLAAIIWGWIALSATPDPASSPAPAPPSVSSLPHP